MTLKPLDRHRVPVPFGANVNDPNNTYCFLCNIVTGADRNDYDNHMEKEHQTIQYTPVNKDVVPDIEDPNRHCKACDVQFRSPETYHYHFKTIHQIGIDEEKYMNEEDTPEKHPEVFICEICRYPFKG